MFSKKTQGDSPSPMRNQSAGSPGMAATFSMLAADLVVKGGIEASADLHIDGTVEGDVACTALVQGETSTITGAIRASTVRLAGTVIGPIDANQLVIVKTAHVRGDVTYDSLTVEPGAEIEGRLSRRQNGSEAPLLLVG